jgi:microcystin-dependent protein
MPSDPFIGTVMPWAPNFSPRGWALCQGQLLAIAQNSALFSILGTVYGGDGRTTFGLPDLRGRVAIHPGNGPGLSPYLLGAQSGQETVALGTNTIPSHTHAVSQDKGFEVLATTHDGNQQAPSPTDRLSAAKLTFGVDANLYSNVAEDTTLGGLQTSGALALNNAGNGQAHQNRQPYLVLNYVIALVGVFPS